MQEINRSFVWNDVALLKNLPKECGENQAVRVDEKCLESIRKVVDIVKRKQSLENKLENNIEQAKARYAQMFLDYSISFKIKLNCCVIMM